MVMAFEPTDVAIAFATSFAPIPHAMNMPKAPARIIYTVVVSDKAFVKKSITFSSS
jgi:hypothetical protein